jgi:hypothetical protein
MSNGTYTIVERMVGVFEPKVDARGGGLAVNRGRLNTGKERLVTSNILNTRDQETLT